MLLLRSSSSRLAALARNRPAGAFSSSKAASRQPLAVVSVASPSRTEECAQERNGSGAVASVLSSASNKAAATKKKSDKKNKLVASALGSRGAGEASPPDRTTSEALVAALQQPAGDDIASSSDEAAENKSRSEIQALAARLWSAYDAALTDHPIAVKSATSFVGFLLGDLIAQSIVGLPYDARRTLRLVAFGVFMDGPIGHLWYTTLDRNVFPKDPTATKAVVAKTVLDQLLWAPAFSCVFFAFVNLFEGRPDLIVPAISAKLLPMLAANYALWPLAHLINFKFVPSKQRILYINCVQILWSAYLSHLSAGAIRAAGRF